MLVLTGIGKEDTIEDVRWTSQKVVNMRLFEDKEGKPNLSAREDEKEILIVSQFTLLASTKKGNRPSYINAAPPAQAIPLYERFLTETELLLGKPVQSGQFGADMQVYILNDGPVTIVLDSKNKQ